MSLAGGYDVYRQQSWSAAPPKVCLPKNAVRGEYEHSPTREAKARSDSASKMAASQEEVEGVSVKSIARYVQIGRPVAKIPLITTEREQAVFMAEVEVANKAGYEVEWVTGENEVTVFTSLMGEMVGKALAKSYLMFFLTAGGMVAISEVIHKERDTTSLTGCLVPDISGYVRRGSCGSMESSSANHGDLAVEIEWLSNGDAAVEKANRYFQPNFLGPNNSLVREVWTVLLTRKNLTKPDPPPADVLALPVPFDSLENVTAGAAGRVQPVIVIYQSRGNTAFPPAYVVLDWGVHAGVPAGSLYTGAYLGGTALLEFINMG